VADRSLIEFASLLAELSESSINVVPEIQRTKISFNSPKPRKIRDILEDISAVYGFRIEYRPDMTIIHPERRFGNFEPEKPDSVSLKEYGISEEDLDVIGFQSAEELGRGVVDLAGAKGEEGEAFLSLTGAYAFEFEYMDLREPYLIAKGRLVEKDEERTLLENTLYLEPEQPSLLGLTNLREALILMVKRLGS
jgi:hypothetical protein